MGDRPVVAGNLERLAEYYDERGNPADADQLRRRVRAIHETIQNQDATP
jgi:hypothetical protein